MNKLNPHQRKAVRYIDSPLLVLAGAGSGKTRAAVRPNVKRDGRKPIGRKRKLK